MAITIVRRLYFYAAAFIGLQMLAAGARDLLGTLLDRLIAPPSLGGADQAVFRLSASAALLLIGLLLWAIHWWVVQRGAARAEEQRSSLRRLYAYLVLLVVALSALFGLRDLLCPMRSRRSRSLSRSGSTTGASSVVIGWRSSRPAGRRHCGAGTWSSCRRSAWPWPHLARSPCSIGCSS